MNKLPILSKVTEKGMLSQLITQKQQNNLLPDYMSAYRANSSTESVLLKLTSDILMAMDSQSITALVACDLSAAFDTVDHNILLNLQNSSLNITGKTMEWFRKFKLDLICLRTTSTIFSAARILRRPCFI